MNRKIDILAIIPARSGSKGIPNKNIKILGDKPLIQYSIDTALKCSLINKTIVSTDSQEIARIAISLGAEAPFIRPQHLAADNSPTIDTVIHTIEYLKEINIEIDTICLLQPTSPFRSMYDLEAAINHFKATKAESLISVTEVPHSYNPHWVFEKVSDNSQFLKLSSGDKEIIHRRQELPKCFIRNGSIYLTKTKTIMENKSLYGDNITWYEMEQQKSVNIDTLSDWVKAEKYLIANNLTTHLHHKS